MTVLSHEPIRVFSRDGTWTVDYDRDPTSCHLTKGQALERATRAAHLEHRQLVIEAWPRTRERNKWWSSAEPAADPAT
jgi:hypothetical protein